MTCPPLPPKWWQDPEILEREVRAHGGPTAAAQAHGSVQSTLSKWWRKHGFPPFQPGTAGATPEDRDVVSEEEILRERVRELEGDARADRKQHVWEERILRAIRGSLQAREPRYSPAVIKRQAKQEEHEFALLWSDCHAGEVVSREETNGLNSYDWDTMLARWDALRRGVLSFQEHRPYPVRKLHIWSLGDQLSGDIHDELVETNEIPLAEATVQFGLDGAEFVESFVPYFEKVSVAGIVGNHPRARRKPPAKRQFDNADWTALKIMEQALRRCSAVDFEVPKAPKWPVEVCNRRILLMHGHGIRSTMPGVPWGGVMRRVGSLQNEYAAAGMPIDHFVLGHFHQSNVVQAGRIVMNGSVKGIDEYSLQAFGGGSPPQQILLTFHPRRGLVDASIIDLEAV